MPLVFQYLLKLSISLTILYLFYFFVLRRLTFYTYNRWYLLGYSLLSFFIAAINISPFVNTNTAGTFTWIRHFPSVPQFAQSGASANNVTETVAATVSWQLWDYITLILVGGILFLIGRLLIQIISFRKIKRKASRVPAEGINIYQVNAPIIPFSFGKNIYINSSLHAPQELEKIIQHEFVHVKQKHTIDIICSEIICFLNWYNPFAWLIRKAIRQNLEYIADDKVIRNGINKKEYQYLLLKVIGNQKFSIATPFNFSSLKKRIAMMNKLKTSKIHVLKFMFLLPLMATVLLAFRSVHNPDTTPFTYGGVVLDNKTGQPIADVKVLEQNSGIVAVTDKNGFFSFKTTDQVIDNKLSIDGSTTPVQFRYSRNIPDTKSFLVLVKAQQQGQSLNILSSSIAMEWDGSAEEAIKTGKNYAIQPAIQESTEQFNNGGVRIVAKGRVTGKSGNSSNEDMFIMADSITLQFNSPSELIIYADNIYTAKEYSDRFSDKAHITQAYIFSKKRGMELWGDRAKEGVLMLNENPSFKKYMDVWQLNRMDTIPNQKKLDKKKNGNQYPDTLTWVTDGRADHDDFLKRHPEVVAMDWSNSNEQSAQKENGKVLSNTRQQESHIKLTLKNGATEKYNLNNEGDMKRFKDKYGELPVAAPPPPMPPSVPSSPGIRTKSGTTPAPPTPPAPPAKVAAVKKMDAQPLQLVKTVPVVTVQDPPKVALTELKLEYVKVDNNKIPVEKLNTEQLQLVKKLPSVTVENTQRLEYKEVQIENIILNDKEVPAKKLNAEEIKLVKKLPGVTVENTPKITLKEVKVEKVKSKE